MSRLTKEHFDAAVAQRWGINTCLLAQHAKANGFPRIPMNGTSYAPPYNSAAAWKIMNTFDEHFDKVGDENKPELQELRASLPIEL